MIEVKNLTKRFNTYLALNSISFTASPGEVVGLLGPNGAGKTTTMRILTGFMPPSSGTATIAGFDVVEQSMDVRKRVGYMPERIPIYPDMTVEGYVAFWAKLRGVRNTKSRVQAVLEQVQLGHRRKTLIRHLSKGMKQRLGLAQALVHEPEVIILDEPTIGIDPKQVIEVREAVRELGQHHTVLFSTHILSEAEQVCDRVVIIHQGHVIAEGRPEELRQKLQPENNLYVQIGDADETTAQQLLQSIPGIIQVVPQGMGFAIRTPVDNDIRPLLNTTVINAGYSVLELRPVAMTLEDIFLDLVSQEEA